MKNNNAMLIVREKKGQLRKTFKDDNIYYRVVYYYIVYYYAIQQYTI